MTSLAACAPGGMAMYTPAAHGENVSFFLSRGVHGAEELELDRCRSAIVSAVSSQTNLRHRKPPMRMRTRHKYPDVMCHDAYRRERYRTRYAALNRVTREKISLILRQKFF